MREDRRLSALRRRGSMLAGVALTSSTLMVASAQAATYTVTGTGDDASGTLCATPADTCATLRDAISQVKADKTVADTITFAPNVTGTITLAHGPLAIDTEDAPVTIDGPGAGTLTVSGGGASGIITDGKYTTGHDGAPVTISGLTLTDGLSSTSGGAIDDSSYAPLTLNSVSITNSQSTAQRTSSSPDVLPGKYGGGAVFDNTSVTITGSTFTNDTAPNGYGGAINVQPFFSSGAELHMTSSTVSDSSAKVGGGIHTGEAYLYLGSSQVTGNSSDQAGGGVHAVGGPTTVRGSTISDNTAGTGGGGVYATPEGVTIDHTTISGNTGGPRGGGVELVTLPPSSSSTPKYSGDYTRNTVIDSTISGNQAAAGAGMSFAGGYLTSPFTIRSSTIADNVGTPATGVTGTYGGGLLVSGSLNGPFDVIDSTVAGNTAQLGAGVSLGDPGAPAPLLPTYNGHTTGSIAFDNSTVAGNAASAHAGGVYFAQYKSGASSYGSATAALDSTIVAGNTAAGAANDLERGAAATTGGFNAAFSLVQVPNSLLTTSQSVITGENPQLGPLTDNGGPTQTMLPSGTSPVIDQGDAPQSLPFDQRGDRRTVDTAIPNPPAGDGTDIGAAELPASSVAVPPPTPPPVTPTAGTTLSIRGAGLGLSSRPLLVGDQTPVTCSVKTGYVDSCVLEVRGAGRLLANGIVTSTAKPSSLSTEVTPTKSGRAYLAKHPLGVAATVTLAAGESASGTRTVTGNVTFLAGPSITLGLGARSSRLSSGVVTELGRVAKLLAGAKSYTCTAYTSPGKNSVSLTKTVAGSACSRLKRDGLKGTSRAVGKGTAHAIASNKTKKGQAANRRLTITFTF